MESHLVNAFVEQQNSLLNYIPLLPLCGSLLVMLFAGSSEKRHSLSGWLATVFAAASFVLTVKLFGDLQGDTKAIASTLWHWFGVGKLSVNLAFRLDHLSAVMTLVVTGVGSLIHLYAIGYMAEDSARPRFFAYLNLFLFAMLLLVLGDNLLVMFVGWEGVGLCSYLLIGFWFGEMPNAQAGQKAFVVNRIGDAGFILGIFTLFLACGTVEFVGLEKAFSTMPPELIELAALLLFVGAVGKSAQIPLYVWLPDAMAGPTPVSALIHAATMVTSGIYMITRMSFLYTAAPYASTLILIIGTATAFLAATIALVQWDIKKVLAYSTVSQLGYMFMALGVGAFSNGIYHVVTHAFFKACLFMGAGSVIIGCHHEQDMRHFGGLRKTMPITFLTYLVATLAIAGVPGLSGFYSKDAILWTVFSSDGVASGTEVLAGLSLSHLCWGIGLLTAFMTAFYMTRSLMMTFFGEYRGHAHPHESPWVVTLPLVVLATASAGFAVLYGEALLHFLAVWTRADIRAGHEALAHNEMYHLLEEVSIAVALAGVGLAAFVYAVKPAVAVFFSRLSPPVYRLLEGKWFVDEAYDRLVVRPLRGLAQFAFCAIDRVLVDGTVNGAGAVVEANGEILSRLHVGRIGVYAFVMLSGSLLAIVLWLLIR